MKRADSGLTLVELLVGLTICGIVMTSIVKMFTAMSAGYTTQNGAADLQQSVRAVADLMIQELRMAGFSAVSERGFGITEAEKTRIGFTVDWDNDGLVTSSHSGNDAVFQESDRVSYFFDQEKQSLQRRTGESTASVSTQTLLGGSGDHMKITGLEFSYYDGEGTETSVQDDIRSIGLLITAEIPVGRKGRVERTYEARITCRNLGS